MEIKLKDVTLHYVKEGSGDPLLMIHGNGEDHSVFFSSIERLSRHYTVYAVDSRNHGLSTMTDVFSYETMADDYQEMMGILGLSHVTIVGFSDGGIIGLILASRNPSWLKKLFALGANLEPKGVKPKVNRETEEAYALSGNPFLKLMLDEPKITVSMLRRIEAETVIIAGSLDVIMKRHTLKIARHIRHAQCKILEGETHDSYVRDADKLVPLIMES